MVGETGRAIKRDSAGRGEYQIAMAGRLKGITAEQRRELEAMLARLGSLWADLTKAAASEDKGRVEAIKREIALCRKRVEEIKRAGTIGSA